jgi:hypothetical protein
VVATSMVHGQLSCCLSGKGGGGHVSTAKWARFCIHNRQERPGSSEQDRQLRDLCIPLPLPRWHDTDPLGGLSPAYIPEILKGRRGGARAVYRVLSDEAAEFHRKPRSYMATIALVGPSRTVLIRWSNSCATIAPSARD